MSSYNRRGCFGSGDPLDDIFCQRHTCELCGNDAHYGYDCPPQVPFVYDQDLCFNQNFDNNLPQTSPSLPQYLCCTRCGGPHKTFQCDQLIFDEPFYENCGGPHMSFQCQPMNQNFYNSNSSNFDQFKPSQYPVSFQPPEECIQEFLVKHAKEMITTVQSTVKIVIQQHEQAVQKKQEEQATFTPFWKLPIFDNDDDEYTIQYKEYLENSSNAITPDLSTEEPDNSLSMGDEHLDTIPKMESDEVIKSSVEDLVPIPSESRIDSLLEEFAGELAPINLIPLGIHEADFDPKEDIRLIEQLLYDDYALSDDDPFYSEDIDYIEASPPDSELKSDTSLSYSDNSLPEFETFSDHTEETSSDSTTTHADNSLPMYDSFLFEIEPDQGELTSVVMKDILGEPRVPNVLPTHPTHYLDSDFAPSDDSLESDLVVSFPSGTRNKIFDPGIFIEV
ncbi:hypothetical protein Tco_0733938 [Tanacetum coccineum]